MDDILQQKEKVEYHEIIKSLNSGQCLFIEGRPGCGKTTFVHKISRDWAASSFRRTMRLVLPVSLRVLNNLCKSKLTLTDILQLYENLKVSEKTLYARDGKGVCFIFDGFDEFSPSDGKESIVHQIINKKCLKHSIVIVASRPSATARIRDKADKVVEVLGFKRDQIHEYFDAYPFSCTPDPLAKARKHSLDSCSICRPSKSLKLKSYLSQHLNILHMCYLPIHAFMVAFLFEATGKVPQTETEIYTHFTKFLVLRNLSKNSEIHLDDIDVYNMSGEEGKLFNQICKLALEKTISNKQVLHEDEVNSYFQSNKDKDVSLGLIAVDCTADQYYRFKSIYTFLHLSFQEYLAAYHISTLPDEEQAILIQRHGNKNHMLNVWKFYCGLVEIKVRENKFKSILKKTEGKVLFHIQCAYESQQKLACVQLLKSLSYHIELNNKYLSTPDLTAMGYVINTSESPIRLSVTNCNINIEAIDALLTEMEDRAKHSLQALHYESEIIENEEVQCIVKLLVNFGSLKTLCIESRKKAKVVPSVYSKSVTYHFSDITELMVYNLDIRQTHLLHNLPQFAKLETICLINCIPSLEDIEKFAGNLGAWCTNLKNVNVSSNNISNKGAMMLANGMQYCRSPENIDISNNKITIFGHSRKSKTLQAKIKSSEIINQKKNMINNGELFCSLEACTNLQSLDTPLTTSVDSIETQYFSIYSKKWVNLKELQIAPYPWHQLRTTAVVASCLQNFKFLQVFVLRHGRFDVEGARNLAEGLLNCPELEVIDLAENMISAFEMEAMAEGLAHCTCLKEVNLNSNRICNEGAEILSLHIRRCQKLEVLKLRYNDIGKDGAKSLATNLKGCTQLKLLDVHGNEIGAELSQMNVSIKIVS